MAGVALPATLHQGGIYMQQPGGRSRWRDQMPSNSGLSFSSEMRIEFRGYLGGETARRGGMGGGGGAGELTSLSSPS